MLEGGGIGLRYIGNELRMIDRILQCIVENCQMLPTSIYVWFGVVLCAGMVLFWSFLGLLKGTQWVAGLLLVEYLVWIFCMAVFFRGVQATRSFNLAPFWSYGAIHSGNRLFMVLDIMNVTAFVPVGFLLCCSIGLTKWWQVLLIGIAISVGIEVLQFVLLRGFAEFDDVFHNALGCLVGYEAHNGISSTIRWYQNRHFF